jgi:hypothetical protein
MSYINLQGLWLHFSFLLITLQILPMLLLDEALELTVKASLVFQLLSFIYPQFESAESYYCRNQRESFLYEKSCPFR